MSISKSDLKLQTCRNCFCSFRSDANEFCPVCRERKEGSLGDAIAKLRARIRFRYLATVPSAMRITVRGATDRVDPGLRVDGGRERVLHDRGRDGRGASGSRAAR